MNLHVWQLQSLTSFGWHLKAKINPQFDSCPFQSLQTVLTMAYQRCLPICLLYIEERESHGIWFLRFCWVENVIPPHLTMFWLLVFIDVIGDIDSKMCSVPIYSSMIKLEMCGKAYCIARSALQWCPVVNTYEKHLLITSVHNSPAPLRL